MPKQTPPLPIPARRALTTLGADLRNARLRRRIRTAVLAERALISRGTLRKIEAGDGSVSMAAYACVLFALGLAPRLEILADPNSGGDPVGLDLSAALLPKRIARARRPQASP